MLFRSLALVLCCAAPVAAQEDTDPIAAARLSAGLFSLAQEQGDALLMIAAAKLRKQAAVPVIDRVPERDGDAPDTAALPAPPTWESMLEAAAALAAENPQLRGLIDDVRAETARGVRTGRVESITGIRAGGTNTYRPLEFAAGAYADVYVEGAGGADLNLFVRDAAGRLVCSDTGISAIAYCGWQPDRAQAFSVEVLNKGRAATTYRLMTN